MRGEKRSLEYIFLSIPSGVHLPRTSPAGEGFFSAMASFSVNNFLALKKMFLESASKSVPSVLVPPVTCRASLKASGAEARNCSAEEETHRKIIYIYIGFCFSGCDGDPCNFQLCDKIIHHNLDCHS